MLLFKIYQSKKSLHSLFPYFCYMTYMIISPNYRQILQVLGFFNEPQQAPMLFVPAALQTGDATSSLPGAL
jgi:hypothetical protein